MIWPFKHKPDAALTDAPGDEYKVRKPIRVRELPWTGPGLNVLPGDTLACTFTGVDLERNEHVRREFPPCRFVQSMYVNMACQIEVIDEFGMDAGVGLVVGQRSKK